MSKGFLVLLGLLFWNTSSAAGFDCAPATPIAWEQVSPGVQFAKYDLRFTPYLKDQQIWDSSLSRSVTVRALKVDLSLNQFLLHRPAQNLPCDVQAGDRYIQKMIEDMHAPVIAATNASFFVMPDQDTLGLAFDGKKLWRNDLNALTISSAGVFGIEAGLPFLQTKDEFVSHSGATPAFGDLSSYSLAIEAYPRLLANRNLQISDAVQNIKCSRTSIGTDLHTNEVLLVTIDAAGYTSQTGMTLFEYANLLKEEKCGVSQNLALNLDGGGSTSFAIPSKNIYQQVDRCRHLGNILTIQKR